MIGREAGSGVPWGRDSGDWVYQHPVTWRAMTAGPYWVVEKMKGPAVPASASSGGSMSLGGSMHTFAGAAAATPGASHYSAAGLGAGKMNMGYGQGLTLVHLGAQLEQHQDTFVSSFRLYGGQSSST